MASEHILTVGHLRSVGLDPTDLGIHLGSTVTTVRDRSQVPALVRTLQPSAVLVEFTTPTACQALCSSLRAVTSAHLAVITRQLDPDTANRLLEAGADQVLTGDTSIVDALRSATRPARSGSDASQMRRHAGLRIDIGARTVTLDGRRVELTRIEFEVLEILTRHPRMVTTRSQLLNQVWDGEWSRRDHLIDVTVGRLRAKLGESGSRPRFLETVRGVGFRFNPQPATGAAPESEPLTGQVRAG